MEVVSIEYGTLAVEFGCVFHFFCRLFVAVFPFSAKYRQILGDWHVSRQGAPNCSVRFPILS
jgi:hypothetical protein